MDISITSGARYNQAMSYEKFSSIENEGRLERNNYYSFHKDWSPFIAIQSSFFEFLLKKQKKGRSLSLKLEGGLFFHQVKRDHEFHFLYEKFKETDSTQFYITGFDDILSYTTKSNNLGISINVIFVKKWSKLFDFEYGIVYKSDFSFSQNISYNHQAEDGGWRGLQYSNSHYLKNRFSQEIYLYLGTMFNLNERLSLGLTIELPTFIYGSYIFSNHYPIVGTENNFNNRNAFFGLKCAYKFNK
jgi:hypothetical protein